MRMLHLAVMMSMALIQAAPQKPDKPMTRVTTFGNCSPVVSHVKGNVDIHCEGLDPRIVENLVKFAANLGQINTALTTQRDTSTEILGRLDVFSEEFRNFASRVSGTSCGEERTRPYKCISSEELARLLEDERKRLEDLVKYALFEEKRHYDYDRMNGSTGHASSHEEQKEFAETIRTCCINEMEDLRAEAFRRIGPSAHTRGEEFAWGHIQAGLQGVMAVEGLWPETVREYAPYWTAMSEAVRLHGSMGGNPDPRFQVPEL